MSRLRAFLEAPARYLLGRDVFFSYSRADAGSYVPKLVARVRERVPNASVYLDQWLATPNPRLPSGLKRQVRWSGMLVFVATEHALASVHVREEISLFTETPRVVVPVVAGVPPDSIDWNAEPWVRMRGAAPQVESVAALQNAEPSDAIVDRIANSITFVRQDQRLRRTIWQTIAVVLALIIGSAVFVQVSVRRASEAEERERKARENEARAAKEAQAALNTAKEARRLAADLQIRSQEEYGRRATLLAEDPGRERDALLAGVLGVAPSLRQGDKPPVTAVRGIRAALLAARRSLPVPGGWVHDVRFTTDMRQVVTLSADGIRWWDRVSGALIRHVPGDQRQLPISFCGASRLVVTGSIAAPQSIPDKIIRFWDVDTGSLRVTLHPGFARSVVACSSNRRLAVVEGSIWNLENHSHVPIKDGLPGSEVRFSTDGRRLLTDRGVYNTSNGSLEFKLFEPREYKDLPGAPLGPLPQSPQFVEFAQQDKLIVTASVTGMLSIWTADSGQRLRSFEVSPPRYGRQLGVGTFASWFKSISAIAVSPDGLHVATANTSNVIAIWRISGDSDRPAAQWSVVEDEYAPKPLRLEMADTEHPIYGTVTDLEFIDNATVAYTTEAGRTSMRSVNGSAFLETTTTGLEPFALHEPRRPVGLERPREVVPRIATAAAVPAVVTAGYSKDARIWSLEKSILGYSSVSMKLEDKEQELSSYVKRACDILRVSHAKELLHHCDPAQRTPQ